MPFKSMSRYSHVFLELAKYHKNQLSSQTNYDCHKNLEHTFGTIIFSVTYLENYVNEIISDITDTQDADEDINPNKVLKNSGGKYSRGEFML